MAGVTHSAFRRLVSDFGGAGALYTEMLAAKQILGEHPRTSPWLRRRPREGRVFYQLMASSADRLDAVVDALRPLVPDGLDLNLACHAPGIRKVGAGSRLFDHIESLAMILATLRRAWSGVLTVKLRLGHQRPGWEEVLANRLRLFQDSGVDALVIHPRFFEDKFRSRARHEWLAWIAERASLPIVASGDLTQPRDVQAPALAPAAAAMLGRMAAVRPWVFTEWSGTIPVIDPGEVWQRFTRYVMEDFAPTDAVVRLKIYAAFYARNFAFGHRFHMAVQNAASLEAIHEAAHAFFARQPELLPRPNLLGL